MRGCWLQPLWESARMHRWTSAVCSAGAKGAKVIVAQHLEAQCVPTSECGWREECKSMLGWETNRGFRCASA